MVSQDCYLDGLSDEDATFVTTLGREDQFISPPDFRDLVAAHHVQSRQISLPISGDITLTFIQATPDEGNADIVR